MASTPSKSSLSSSDQALFSAIETLDLAAFVQVFDGARSAKLRNSHDNDRTPLMALVSNRVRGAFSARKHLELSGEILRLLLPVSDPRATDLHGFTPFLIATLARNEPAIEALGPLSNPADTPEDGMTALMAAAIGGTPAILRAVLPFSNPAARDRDGWTALMGAALHGNAACVSILLPAIDANAACHRGRTPLMEAASKGRAESVKLLLEHSDATLVDEDGKTALMHAVAGNSQECVELFDLRSAGLDAQGRTLLMRAAMADANRSVSGLLPSSDPNAVDPDGNTALLLGLLHGASEPLLMELAKATDAQISNKAGDTAYALASGRKLWPLVHALTPAATDAEFEAMLIGLADTVGPMVSARLEAMFLRSATREATPPSSAPASPTRKTPKSL